MKKLLLSVSVLFVFHCMAQDSILKKDQWTLNGYMKDLNIINLDKNFSKLYYTQLLHNRMNVKWKGKGNFSGALELRNRFYWGDEVSHTPGFSKQLRNDQEALDLSITWFSNNNILLHSNIERGWLEYRKTKWNMRAGRQRINWGMANTWNLNDIFNSYNFLDYDYEERPGSDAVKYQRMTGDLSFFEVAAAICGSSEKIVSAARYFTNYRGYDLQLLSGWYKNKWTAGLGWAGSIGDIGFKGEGSFYTKGNDSAALVNVTMELDYVYENGWYLAMSSLFNNKGLNSSPRDWSQVNFKISPENLMPAKWNFLMGASKEFTPLFTGRMNLVYAPGMQLLIIYPVLSYNIKTNLDADFLWQSFFTSLDKKFQAVVHTGFLRLKWSF